MNKISTPIAKTHRSLLSLSQMLFGCLLLTSCQADIKSVPPTPNPNPKDIYEITVTVENAPGEFTSAEGVQDFYIVNSSQCIPPYTSMSGAPPVAISDSRKIRYKRVSPNTFVTRVIMDAYIPKDDYGRGLCKWGPASVSVTLYNGVNEYDASIDAPKSLKLSEPRGLNFLVGSDLLRVRELVFPASLLMNRILQNIPQANTSIPK